MLFRSVIRSGTPLKLVNLQKSARGEGLTSARLVQQNTELKKKNNELLHLLKKSKDVIKNEMGKYKAENVAMKKFAETVWVWVEDKLESKLKEEMKPLIDKSKIKVNITATNYTDQVLADEEAEFINIKDSQKDSNTNNLMEKLNEIKVVNNEINKYLFFLERSTLLNKENTLILDSENVESDTENDMICRWTKGEKSYDETPMTMPSFIKSLRLGST